MQKLLIPVLLVVFSTVGCTRNEAASSRTDAARGSDVRHTEVAPVVDITPLPPSARPAKLLTNAEAQHNLSKKFDQDGDGRVSTREMLQQALTEQMRADANHDGKLSADEFHRGLGDVSGKDPYIRELFSVMDENKDGVLDEQEIARRAWAGIIPMDVNHDGFVDAAESHTAVNPTH